MIGTPRRTRALTAGLVVVALALASCGGDGEDDAGRGERTTTTGAASSTTAGDGDDAEDRAVAATAAPDGEVATAEPVPSAGCGTSTVAAVEAEKRTLPGSDRWYLLTTPGEHDGRTPLPLVLDFHGLAEGAEIHAQMSGFGAHATANGYVAVFPHGTGQPVRWDVALDREGNPDMVYTDRLLDQLEQDLCIDTARVYATGLSNGAFMSSALACTMSDRVAAVAPVAGIQRPDGCDPERPVPVLANHGTEDPILLFNGGVRTGRLGSLTGGQPAGDTGAVVEEEPLPEADLDGEGYPAAAAAWAEANGCEGDPVDDDRTGSVIRRTWDCPVEAPVVFDIIEGGGHSWPGSEFSRAVEAIVGPTDMSIDATDDIWRFFRRFALPPT